MEEVSTPASVVSADLYARVRARFTNGHIVLFEVGDGAGRGNSGWSDAIAMQTWPSKGLRLTGMEVKATRSDWKRELDRPGKNESWLACCHEWYVVAPAGVVEIAEMPAGWGLLVPAGATMLRIAKRSERPEPAPVTLDLLAAVFRAAGSVLRSVEANALETMRREAVAPVADKMERIERERNEARANLKALTDALGGYWSSDSRRLELARLIRETEPHDIVASARVLVERARTDAAKLERLLEQFGMEGQP